MTADQSPTAMPILSALCPRRPARRAPALPLITVALALLGGCAVLEVKLPTAGQTEAEVIARMGAPTGRHTLPAGAQRLEYATGPYGRHTWMVDLDGTGKVTRSFQALTEANFATITDGQPREAVLRLIGRPAEKAGEYMNRQTWSWRYPTNDCLWVRITFEADGRVRGGASFLPDPRCDGDQSALPK